MKRCGRAGLLQTALFALAVVWFIGLSTHNWLEIGENIVDDGFIYLRYADNLIRGEGLVYNPGERVEGYTSFLWVMLLAGGLWLGAPAVTLVKLLGVIFGVATIWFVWRAARLLVPESPWCSLLAVYLLVLNRTFIVWSVAGLETKLFGCCLAAAYWSWIRFGFGGPKHDRIPLTGILMGLLPLARPEGYLFGGLIGLLGLIDAARGQERRRFLISAAVAAIIAGAHLLSRITYYGDIVPNPFHAKVTGLHVEWGFHYLWMLVGVNGLHLYGALAVVGAVVLVRTPNRRTQGLFAALAVAAVLAYLLAIGGDYFEFRMLDMALPFWVVLATAGLARVVSRIPRPVLRVAVGAALSAVCLVVDGHTIARPWEGYEYVTSPEREARFTRRFLQAGRWLARNLGPGESIAIRPAGAIAYLTRARCLDLQGLNDREIAIDDSNVLSDWVLGHQRMVTPEYARQRGYTYWVGHPKFSIGLWPGDDVASIEVEPGLYLRLKILDARAKFKARPYTYDEHDGSLDGTQPREPY